MKTILLDIFRPSTFKIGFALSIILVLTNLFFVGSSTEGLGSYINTQNNRFVDYMMNVKYASKVERLRAQGIPSRDYWKYLTSGRIVVVDIDEKSLKEQDKGGMGQWPWPRNVVADLLRKITNDEAKVIGLDIVFSEKDRTSPVAAVATLEEYLGKYVSKADLDAIKKNEKIDHDRILAGALYDTPTILGYVFELKKNSTGKSDKLKSDELVGRPLMPEFNINVADIGDKYNNALKDIDEAKNAVLNIPVLRDSSLSQGFFNPDPDPDGVVRRVPLLIKWKGVLYPSLAFEMLREGLEIPPEKVLLEGDPDFIFGIKLGDKYIKSDRKVRIRVNFRGEKSTFPYVSAVDVLTGNFPKGTFKDRFVLVGTSAPGLRDNRTTPLDQVCPGVEVHATIIDNVLKGDILEYDESTSIVANAVMVLVGGILISLGMALGGPIYGGLFALGCILFATVGNYYFIFQRGQVVGVVLPVVSFVVVTMVLALYNYFIEGRQKRQIRGAFSLYLSPTVVNQVSEDPEALKLEGQQKELTVLFSDIRGFTSISEKMTPHDLTNFLNEYLTPMSDIVMNTGGGTVDKFMGDAVMAFWGAPLDDPQHAPHAARAALAMMERLRTLQPQWQRRGLPPIDIGIGLNTGVMSVGNMGSQNRFDYTVMGDNVNLGSRLEGLNKMYGTNILISEYTRRAIGDVFFCRTVDLATVKGKKEPVRIYELICEGDPDAALRIEVDKFERAYEIYHQRNWPEALDIFRELDKAKPHTLYKLYIERAELYIANPPEDGWNGVFEHKTK